jgi:hypothetical protein
MHEILGSKGYSWFFQSARSIWYVNVNFDEIYKHLGVKHLDH